MLFIIYFMEYYNKISKSYDELYGKEQEEKLKIIKEKINPRGKILDVGSGTGLSKKYFEDVTCVDPSEKLLDKEDIKAKAENLPFKDNSFDWVICITSVHHFKLEKALKEIKRVSKGNYIFTILKKSPRFKEIKSYLEKNFNLKEIDSEKDLILFNNGGL